MTHDTRNSLDAWYQNMAAHVQQLGFKAVLNRRYTADDAQQTRLKLSNGRKLMVMSMTEQGWVEITEMNLLNDGFRRHRQKISDESEANAMFTLAWQQLVGVD
ncbi:hypothetical protein [Reinekea blandensis]|uniref:Uncharacterized protein n=1 Tax=Reinekea blandensis MED297 TaxID=314283 RepID=A4BB59_9GAMM|nr:hypothetical protein [Reinekea blandensis]EAR10672.1 hypothetical protein MED297_11670 [Reinekea sp. MED297] [Reinekea blandensis MED297]